MNGLALQRLRLLNQRLWGAPLGSPGEVVSWLGAVQAQDYGGARWAVAQRARRCTDADVETAFDDGRILRTHVMRPTWHFVAPADIRWMLALTSPRVHARNALYYRRCELDAPLLRRTRARIERALRDGRWRTRAEIARTLADGRVPADGMRLAYIVMHAELTGIVCSGPRRGLQHTYALLEERAPAAAPLGRDEALAALATRYFRSHGPATARDLATWSGLTVADARRGAEAAGLARVEARDRIYWHAGDPPAARRVRPPVLLLPNYDEYLVAYADREPPDPALLAASVRPAVLFAGHLVVHNGRLVGGWRRELSKRTVDIEVRLAMPLDKAGSRALAAAAAAYARFAGDDIEAKLRVIGV